MHGQQNIKIIFQVLADYSLINNCGERFDVQLSRSGSYAE